MSFRPLAQHAQCTRNRAALLTCEVAGCFHCCSLFPARDVQAWCDAVDGEGRTALCPHCGVDSVLPCLEGGADAQVLLQRMELWWFARRWQVPFTGNREDLVRMSKSLHELAIDESPSRDCAEWRWTLDYVYMDRGGIHTSYGLLPFMVDMVLEKREWMKAEAAFLAMARLAGLRDRVGEFASVAGKHSQRCENAWCQCEELVRGLAVEVSGVSTELLVAVQESVAGRKLLDREWLVRLGYA